MKKENVEKMLEAGIKCIDDQYYMCSISYNGISHILSAMLKALKGGK